MTIAEHELVPYHAEPRVGRGAVLVLAPHADDEVFGCGGAIMRHAEDGDPIQVIIATDGAFGASDPAGLAEIRRRESVRAAAILGYGEPALWGLPDRGLEYGEQLIRRIEDAIEAQGADLVYAPSWWEMHPDHLTLSLAALEAVRRSPRPLTLALYEIGVPLHPNLLLDITGLRARKQAAITCFASQLAQRAYDRHIVALNCFRTYTLPSSVEAAEAYRLVTRDEVRRDPLQAVRPGHYYAQSLEPWVTVPPLVSIVVQGDDRGALADALDSIALQTYPHLEVLMVAAQRGDEVAERHWCGRFPLRRIDAPVPFTRADALNRALAEARGDYAIVLGRGARFMPDHVVSLVSTLCASEDARCAYSGVRFEISPGGTETSVWSRPFDRTWLWGGRSIPLSAVLFERALIAEGCRFDPALAPREDWDFLVQLSLLGDFTHIDQASVRASRPEASECGVARASAMPAVPMSGILLEQAGRWERATEACDRLNGELQARLDGQARALEEQVRASASLQRRLEAREAELERREALERRLQRTIDELLGSTSWRITGPLRSLIFLLRGASGWLRGRHSG